MLADSFNSYPLVLTLHLAAVGLSLALFSFRLGCQFAAIRWRARWPWLRWLPHANDTLLLSAGIALCVLTGWRPWLNGWLAAKLLFLVLYVLAGKVALAPASSAGQRQIAALLALLSVGSIIFLAFSKPL